MRKIIMLLCLLLVIGCVKEDIAKEKELVKMTLAEGQQPIGALVYIAKDKGYFNEEGLEVEFVPFTSGKACLNAVLSGEADVATTAETPVMFASMKGERPIVLGTIGESSRSIAVAARKDAGIEEVKDLKGKRIGITSGTNGAFFLDMFMLYNDIGDYETVEMKPEESASALQEGKVDAVCTWVPHLFKAQEALGENAIVFYDEDIYLFTWNIVVREDYLKANKENLKGFMAALLKAEQFLLDDEEQAKQIVAKGLGLADVGEAWSVLEFDVSLDQALILMLEQQGEWALEKGLLDKKELPNYLELMGDEVLRDVDAMKVSVIR